MKNILFSSLFIFGTSSFVSAQNYSIQVSEGSEAVGESGSNNALSATVYECDMETVEKEWKSTLKDFKNGDVKTGKHTLFVDNVLIKDMGNNPVDVYTVYSEKKENKSVRMSVAFNLGGAYLSSSAHKEQFEVAKKLIYEFAVKMTKSAVDEHLKTEKKALEKLEDKQKDLEHNKKKMENDIADNKDRIKKAEEDIKKNEENIKKNAKEQEEQKKLIEAQKIITDDVRKKMEAVK